MELFQKVFDSEILVNFSKQASRTVFVLLVKWFYVFFTEDNSTSASQEIQGGVAEHSSRKVKSCRPSQAGSLPAGNAPCGSSLTHHCVSAYLCPLCHAAQVSHTHLSGTWGLLPPGTAGCPLGQRSQHTHDLWSLCSVVRVFLRVCLQERAVSSTLSICSKIRFSPGRILSDLPV